MHPATPCSLLQARDYQPPGAHAHARCRILVTVLYFMLVLAANSSSSFQAPRTCLASSTRRSRSRLRFAHHALVYTHRHFSLHLSQLWPKSQQEKSTKKQEMQQRQLELQMVPEHSNIPTFMRTLPIALLACGGLVFLGLRSVRSHWTQHGAAKTLTAACLAYAGWKSFKLVRKRSNLDFFQRFEPILSLAGKRAHHRENGRESVGRAHSGCAVTYGIVKGAAAVARKILANRV